MFGGLKNFFGIITCQEKNGIITISGVPSDLVNKIIFTITDLRKVNKNILLPSSKHEIKFYSFFAIEIIYILNEAVEKINNYRARRVSKRIIHHLQESTWIKNTIRTDIPSMVDLKRLDGLKWQAKPHQLEFLERFGDSVPRYELNGFLLASAPGTGKCHPLNTLIKVPGGWKQMGDIYTGDIVTAADGTFTPVTGVFPQGYKPVYRITFRDGRMVEAGEEHLWKSFVKLRESKNRWAIRTTAELKHLFDNTCYKDRLYIPLIEPEQTPEVPLPINPYVMGYLLGNDCVVGQTIGITIPDQWTVDEITRLLPPSLELRHREKYDYIIGISEGYQGNEFKKILQKFSLMGCYSYQKFIPRIYLEASTEQRYALLQGLMDSDGTIDSGGVVSYCSSSELLAENVQYLVRSLGGMAAIALKSPTYTYKGEKKSGRPSYQVNIRVKHPSKLFCLPRKKERANDNNQYSHHLKLRIKSIDFIGYKPTQCISIDHPEHLYVVQDFIVTHNTFMDLALAATVIPREIAEIKIIISPKNAIELVWEDTVGKLFKDVPTSWVSNVAGEAPVDGIEYYIFHFESMERAKELCKKLVKNGAKYFIIIDESHNFNTLGSNRTNNLLDICGQKFRDITLPYSIWASGSPIKAQGIEAITLLRGIDPKFTPQVETIFKRIFSGDEEKANEILYHRLGLVSHKIPKSEVMSEKPTPIKINIKLRDGQKYLISTVREEMKAYMEKRIIEIQKDINLYRKTFDHIVEEHRKTVRGHQSVKLFNEYVRITNLLKKSTMSTFVDSKSLAFAKDYEQKILLPSISPELRRKFKDVRSIVKTLLLKVRGEALGKILTLRRAQCAAELAKHCNLEEIIGRGIAKSMVFSSYTLPLYAADQYLQNLGFTTANVYGDTAKQVTPIVRDFHDDPDVNPIMATYKSLSTAVPVTIANQVIMLDMPMRQYIYEQTVARVSRLGQTNPTFVYEIYLDTGNELNVSTRSAEIIKWSRDQVAALIGDAFSGPTDDEYEIEYYDSQKAIENVIKN